MDTQVFQGSVFALVLYDVCEEIHLSKLQALIGGKHLAPTFKHTAPEYVRFERPPVIQNLPPVTLKTGERLDAALHYYDYGVISILLCFAYEGGWEELDQLATRWMSSPAFDVLTGGLIREKIETIQPALVKPYSSWLSEDYYIFHMRASATLNADELLRSRGREISQIVRGETAELSAAERSEVLQGRMSYYPNDLAVVGWNAAFIYDTEAGADTTIRLLEYSNSQLLQFRHYDDLLSKELVSMYRFLEQRRGVLSGWRMRPAAARLRTTLLDVTELTERTNNALKFVGDMFSARLYKLCASKIGVPEYDVLVQEKLHAADDLYDFMIEQFNQARGFLLESVVVLILIIELGFLFHGR